MGIGFVVFVAVIFLVCGMGVGRGCGDSDGVFRLTGGYSVDVFLKRLSKWEGLKKRR